MHGTCNTIKSMRIANALSHPLHGIPPQRQSMASKLQHLRHSPPCRPAPIVWGVCLTLRGDVSHLPPANGIDEVLYVHGFCDDANI